MGVAMDPRALLGFAVDPKNPVGVAVNLKSTVSIAEDSKNPVGIAVDPNNPVGVAEDPKAPMGIAVVPKNKTPATSTASRTSKPFKSGLDSKGSRFSSKKITKMIRVPRVAPRRPRGSRRGPQ